MSDDELSQCGSGLEGLIEDEIIEEAKTSEGSDSESTDASETNAIENDKRKITGTEDEEDFSNDIDDESSNSDLDLNDVIQSEDDEDNSSEYRNEVLEEGINYSELEEEDYDSEAFSFTGITEADERSSKMSFASEVSHSTHSNIVNLRKNEEGLNQVDVNVQQFIDQTIAEEVEVEKAPSITYSRSISDIEEYESVLFEIESDKSWGDDYTVYCRSDDSDSEFSIPRAEKISSNISDGQRCQKDGDANLEDTTDAGLNQNIKPRNNDQHENANSSENKMNGKDVDCYEFQTGGNRDGEIDEFVKCVVNRIAQDLVMDELRKGIQKGQIKSCLQSEINEVNDEKHEKGNEEKQQGIYLNRVETNHSEKRLSGIESHDLKTKSKEETAAPHDEPQVLLSKINAPFVTKEIDDRKMRKKLLKKKERMKLFSSSNRNKNLNKKRRLCCPDPEIPSYKAKLNKEREKQETVDSVLTHLLERSFNKLEDKRIKKETIERFNMISIIVNDIFNEAEEKADKRELEKECQNIVHGILDDIFDTWESKVNADHLIQYEKELETLCSNVVHGTLIISIRDAFGTSGYHDLHKTPKFKKIEYTNEKKERKRTLMSRNQRQNLVESRRKSTLHEETEREKNSKIEMNNQGQNERRESDRKTTEIEEKQVEKNIMGGGDIALVNDRERCIEAIYIDAEDGMSCGLSTVATLTREKPVIYHKEETDSRQADEILLEKKEDETEDSSIGILSQLPPADKDDYCFQWIMNYGKIPRPPLRNYAKDNDGRKKRFIRRANMKCERKLNRPDMEYVIPGKRPALLKHDLSSFESGQSLVESGRESQMSMRSNATLSSRESYRIKVFEEPISKDTIENIRDYFNNDARNRIKARDKAYKEKEEEEEDIRNKKIKDWEDELIHCSTEDSKDKLLEETDAALIDSSEIDSKENYDANLNETEACNLIQKDESEVESILPLESESVEDEEGERFQTPESELEIQPVDETRDIPICEEKMQEPKRKWVWPRGSLIRWKNIEQAFKRGSTSTDCATQVMKMRRSRFSHLTLKPKSVLTLNQTRNNQHFKGNLKSKELSHSQLVLPPITFSKTEEIKSRGSSVECVILPDINTNRRRTSTSITGSSLSHY